VPSQTPVVPQLAAPMSTQTATGSAPPAGTGVQVPCFPVTAQELQLAQGPLTQQTPSVQKLVEHSPGAAQLAPASLRLMQEPDWQVYPAPLQSPLPAQVVRQTPVGPQL
jgi:hypothetical protein